MLKIELKISKIRKYTQRKTITFLITITYILITGYTTKMVALSRSILIHISLLSKQIKQFTSKIVITINEKHDCYKCVRIKTDTGP